MPGIVPAAEEAQMELRFTDEELAFRKEVQAFIDAKLPRALREKLAAGHHPTRDDIVFWQRTLNEKGWGVAHWPVEYGGTGWDAVKQYIFLEKQVDKNYVDRNPNPNGRFYSTIETSSTRSVGAILTELNQKLSNCADATDDHALVNLAHSFLNQGLFDDKYNNISWCAPELPESLIYKTFAHIGNIRF